MLSVELLNKPAEMRLTLVAAEDGVGTNLDGGTGSWAQHSFWKMLNLSVPVNLRATVAIHPNYSAEIVLADVKAEQFSQITRTAAGADEILEFHAVMSTRVPYFRIGGG